MSALVGTSFALETSTRPGPPNELEKKQSFGIFMFVFLERALCDAERVKGKATWQRPFRRLLRGPGARYGRPSGFSLRTAFGTGRCLRSQGFKRTLERDDSRTRGQSKCIHYFHLLPPIEVVGTTRKLWH